MLHGCTAPDLDRIDRHIRLSMIKRGWLSSEILEAYTQGDFFDAVDLTGSNVAATRFVHPESGKSVVINNATGKIIHVGGRDFQY